MNIYCRKSDGGAVFRNRDILRLKLTGISGILLNLNGDSVDGGGGFLDG